jgi:hypothetical protein
MRLAILGVVLLAACGDTPNPQTICERAEALCAADAPECPDAVTRCWEVYRHGDHAIMKVNVP